MNPAELPDWPRAHGAALFAARLRTMPADFQVTEELGWDRSGDGEHDYLWIEKTGANTDWVARQLANYANVPSKDVGYAGMKDRHAITKQWFSVPRWHAPVWSELDVEGVRILEVQRHLRKLRRGAHRANAFRITLRCDAAPDYETLEKRFAIIRQLGVPNYFGEQRFGRSGGNLRLAQDWAEGRRLSRNLRSIAISTIRSFAFNATLAKRVEAGSWNEFVTGDTANLDGTASVFDVMEIDDELRQRCAAMDVHPATALAGKGSNVEPGSWQSALDRHRIELGVRSLRLTVRDLKSLAIEGGLVVEFRLDRGAFATAVLREFCLATTSLE